MDSMLAGCVTVLLMLWAFKVLNEGKHDSHVDNRTNDEKAHSANLALTNAESQLKKIKSNISFHASLGNDEEVEELAEEKTAVEQTVSNLKYKINQLQIKPR